MFDLRSCVADNALGRAKKYIEVSGRPGPASFHSPLYSRSRDVYNLTWSIESVPKLDEIRILYRKLMVSPETVSTILWIYSHSKQHSCNTISSNIFSHDIITRYETIYFSSLVRLRDLFYVIIHIFYHLICIYLHLK